MRLVSLVLRQWRCFERLELEFPDGVIGVRGANGAGKTTIAEAIGWALFGKLRPGQKIGDLHRQGAPAGARATAELVFRLGDTLYRVERTAGGAARLYIGDSLETSQTRATTARIIQELDLTWDTFQRTVFARQKDVAALDPTATAEARKRHVERLLGLERFRVAAEKARGRAKDLEAELRGLREQAPDLDELRVALAAARAEAARNDPEAQAATARAQALHAEVEELEGAVERESERAGVHRRLADEAGRLAVAESEAAAELVDARGRLSERAAKSQRLAALGTTGDDVDALAELRARWEDLATRRQELDDALDALPAGFDPAAADARAAELSRLRDERDAIADAPTYDLVGLEARVQALEAAAVAIAVEEAATRLEAVERKRDAARDQRAALVDAIRRDETHLAEIEEGGAATECPVCLRRYGDDLPRILARHRERLEQARAQAGALQATCTRLDDEHRTTGQALTRAEAAARRMSETSGADDLETAREHLETARGEQDERTRRIGELRGEIPALAERVRADGDARTAEAVVADHRRRLMTAAAVLDVDGYSAANHAAAVETHQAAERAMQERRSLSAAIAATDELPAQVARLESRLATQRAGAAEVSSKLAELAFDVTRLANLRTALAAAREAHDAARDAVTEAKLRAVERDAQVRGLVERVEAAESALEAILARELELREHQAAGTLLSDYRSHQNLRAWPRLEEGASALLSDATDGRYADVRLSEDYRLLVYDRGEAYPLDRFSGGEQDLANLCLRLAIADWVARERNVEVGFVVLDEVFGSQDEERRRRLMTELRSLGNRFHQLLVITHVPDIADLCEHQLEVRLVEAGRSAASFV